MEIGNAVIDRYTNKTEFFNNNIDIIENIDILILTCEPATYRTKLVKYVVNSSTFQ